MVTVVWVPMVAGFQSQTGYFALLRPLILIAPGTVNVVNVLSIGLMVRVLGWCGLPRWLEALEGVSAMERALPATCTSCIKSVRSLNDEALCVGLWKLQLECAWLPPQTLAYAAAAAECRYAQLEMRQAIQRCRCSSLPVPPMAQVIVVGTLARAAGGSDQAQ